MCLINPERLCKPGLGGKLALSSFSPPVTWLYVGSVSNFRCLFLSFHTIVSWDWSESKSMKWIFSSHSPASWQFPAVCCWQLFCYCFVNDCAFQKVTSISIKANSSISLSVLKSYLCTPHFICITGFCSFVGLRIY